MTAGEEVLWTQQPRAGKVYFLCSSLYSVVGIAYTCVRSEFLLRLSSTIAACFVWIRVVSGGLILLGAVLTKRGGRLLATSLAAVLFHISFR